MYTVYKTKFIVIFFTCQHKKFIHQCRIKPVIISYGSILHLFLSLFLGLFMICRNNALHLFLPMKRADDLIYKIRAISAIGIIFVIFLAQNNSFCHGHIPLKETRINKPNRCRSAHLYALRFSTAKLQ